MISKSIQRLIAKYLVRQASQKEIEELELWLQHSENEKEFLNYVKINHAVDASVLKFDKKATQEKLQEHIQKDQKVFRLRKVQKYLKYAAVIAGLTTSLLFITDSFRSKPVEIAPIVTDQTILTLEDGSQVALVKGASFQTKNAKATGEEIIYQAGKDNTVELVYNYLTIPRGAQFSLHLPDGTQVWLNSDTQLKYPIQFRDGESRKVELVYGEAYFDVSPSSDHKGDDFKVLHNKQEVQVVGTQFNIKAYKEEANVYTTLVEGKVNVNFKNMQQKLTPNQQATYNIETGALQITDVEVYNIIAWKEGIFSFENMPLKEIMAVLARWYDIEVVFKNKELETIQFVGVLDMQQNIEEILSILKSTSINNYEIKNRTILLE